MPTITIPTFKGMTPRTHRRLLSPQDALEAVNCKMESGVLEAMADLGLSQASVGSAKTIFRHGDLGWKSWIGLVDVVNSTIVDSGGHYFVTGDGYPKQGRTVLGGSLRRLGVPRPEIPLSVEFLGEAAEGASIARSSSYCFTCVVDMGTGGKQEGAPSDPTGTFDVLDGQSVRLTGFSAPALPGFQADAFRIYRASGGSWFFLAEISGVASSYTDDKSDADLSTVTLATDGWTMPEDDARGMILTTNGIYVMHRDNEILLSEPFHPYVYPGGYRLSTQDQIVALGFIDSSIVVLTAGRPSVLQGSSPASMSMQPLPFDQACVSKGSVVSMPYGVMYASPDGLCLVSPSGPRVATRGLFTAKQWREMQPDLLVSAYFEDKYFGFFQGTTKGFYYDFAAEDIKNIELPGPVYAVFHDAGQDALFLNVGGSIVALEGGSGRLTYRWRSGEFFTSVLTLPAALRIEGDFDSPVSVRLYARDELRHAMVVSSSDPVRPVVNGRSENAWSVELQGTSAVYEVRISTSIEELESGV